MVNQEIILKDRVDMIKSILLKPKCKALVDDPDDLFTQSYGEPEYISFTDSTGCYVVTLKVIIDPYLINDEIVRIKAPALDFGHKRFAELANLLYKVSKIALDIEHCIDASIVAYGHIQTKEW